MTTATPRLIAGNLYRHPSCLDVDMYIVKVSYKGPTYIKLKVKWWNRHGKFFHCDDTVQVKRKDVKRWVVVND